MTSVSQYRADLLQLADPEPYLLAHSGLPGPRGNLELAEAAADLLPDALLERWSALGPEVASGNSPEGFLAFCGVAGLGRRLASGDRSPLPALKAHASDPRWRIREAVAIALQRWGDADIAGLLDEMATWAEGEPYVQRAAAAALCEPRLLRKPQDAARVIELLDTITASLVRHADRKSEQFKTLRQGLGYCWSVAIAANPTAGVPDFTRWMASADPDIRWIVKENLTKKRIAGLFPAA